MARARDLSKLEMGFISPTGEFLACPFCEHEAMAEKIMEKIYGQIPEETLFGAYCTDRLINECGFILIDGCYDVDIQIPKMITAAQKISLGQWLDRNQKFIKWLSVDSINNLKRYLDGLDIAIKADGRIEH